MDADHLGLRLRALELLVMKTCGELVELWREDCEYFRDIQIEVGVSFELFESSEEQYRASSLEARFLQFCQHVFPTAYFNGRDIGRSGVVFAWIAYQMPIFSFRLTSIEGPASGEDLDQLASDIDDLQSLILSAAMETDGVAH